MRHKCLGPIRRKLALAACTLSVAACHSADVRSPPGRGADDLPSMVDLLSASSTDTLSPEQRAERVKEWLSAAAAAKADIDASRVDVAALAAKLGPEPEAAYRWVRDNTVFVPYRGALRGAGGVLMDRQGNSLDRALLLQALLKAGKHNVRLARGRLPEARARELLAAARAPAPERVEVDEDALAARYAKASGLGEAEIRAAADRWAAAHERTKGAAAARTEREAAAIARLLGNTPASGAQPDRLADIEDHWWVQVERDGAFTDLDPTLPDAQPGQPLTTAAETRQIGKLDDLGGEVHRVRVQVTIERWKDGKLTEGAALSRQFNAGDLLGVPITLVNVGSDLPEHVDLKGPHAAQRLRALALAQRVWTPTLLVGGERVVHSAFSATGEITAPPSAGSGPGLGGLFGNALAPTSNNAPPPDAEQAGSAHLTAEFIDYEIDVPGQPARKIRREIVDLLGPAARQAGGAVREPAFGDAQRLARGLGLLGVHQMLVMGAQLSPDAVGHLALTNLGANRDVLINLAKGSSQSKSGDVLGALGQLNRFPMPLFDLANGRSIWSAHRGDVYLERPNIFAYHTLLGSGERGRLSLTEGYDIVASEVAVRPGVKDPSRVRLEQGIFDSNLESVLMRARSVGRAGSAPLSAADLLLQDDAGWIAVRSVADPAWRAVDVPADVRVRIELDLRAGSVVLVPRKPVTIGGREVAGWWRVRPDTGDILGMGERGWGEGTTEYTLVDRVIFMSGAALVSGAVGILTASVCQDGYDEQDPAGADRSMVASDDLFSPACMCLGVAATVTLASALTPLAIPTKVAAVVGAAGGGGGLILGGYCASRPTKRQPRAR